MNLLPFVCALLVIFGLLSTSLFRERISLSNLKTACQGSLRAERKSRNYLESALYIKNKKVQSAKEKKEISAAKPNPQPQKNPDSDKLPEHRDEKIFTTNTKLNLTPLFTEKNPLLYDTTLHYIRALYGKASFYREGLEKQILDQIMASGIALKQRASFTELFPEDPALRTIFYKMLKGTGSYDLDTGMGYPAFDNYFQLGENPKSPAICFREAPTRLLRSLFGEAAAEEILKEESTIKNRLTKDQLTAVLMQKNLNVQTYEGLLSFHGEKIESQLVTISDKKSGISVQKWEDLE